MPIHILIIDDDRTVCSSLSLILKRKSYTVSAVHRPSEVEMVLNEQLPQLILLDMNFTIDTTGIQGIRLLKRIKEWHPQIPIILMTGWATVQLAVEGMKLGASDFIAKPWDNRELVKSIKDILQLSEIEQFVDSDSRTEEGSKIIGSSEAIQDILMMVDRIAKTDASVLITGESGTGKEVIAEAIHQQSKRLNEEFVKVNLGAIPSNLFESEMFGHRKGAFTGAYEDREGRFKMADKGTIFLDEIGELDPANQVKLLRVLQEKTFEQLGSSKTSRTDIRVISATNRDLMSMIEAEKFREDLYYRINLIRIHIPPLRERKEDIPDLVNHFIRIVCNLYNSEIPHLSRECYSWLTEQEYMGNIRQLKNIVERTILMNLGTLSLDIKDFRSGFQTNLIQKGNIGLDLKKIEIQTIKKALNKYNHSISASARALGITRSSLYRRLEKYGIPHEPKI